MNNLISELDNLDIHKGDCLLIHSNFQNLIRKYSNKIPGKLFIEGFLDDLLNKVGENGTLVFPSFTFNFSNNKFTSFKNYDCETGILSKRVLLRNKGQRSFSPVYSFTALGNLSQEINHFKDLKPFRKNSIFNLLENNECKILLINLNDNNGLTYVHYVEANQLVPYRKYKIFSGNIETNSGIIKANTELYVRNNRSVVTDISTLQTYIEENNMYLKSENMRLIKMKTYKNICLEFLKLEKYNMFRKLI